MPKIVAIASRHLALQLALTGIPVREAATPRDAEKAVEHALESDAEVIIIQDTLRSGFSEWFNARLSKQRGKPLLVSCPIFEDENSNVDAYLSAVLKPAIGYEIRLE